jgi:hypothetical protein
LKIFATAAVWLVFAGTALAQPQRLLEAYARATLLVSYMTTYVGETLLACVEAKALTEEQAEQRFAAYRSRNAALLDRVDAWSKSAEEQLRSQGGASAALRMSDDASFTGAAEASRRAEGEVGAARDARAFCAARVAAFESGVFDLSTNPELGKLLAR